MVSASSFGALPVQRRSMEDAVKILRKAFDGGINYFDTANAYSDSEEKIGRALSDVRKQIIISTKSMAGDKKTLMEHAELSLRRMKTDYIDLLQLHNPAQLPDTEDPDSVYGGLLELQKKGWVRFIGITQHHGARARQAVLSGKYDTLQFPLSYLSNQEDLDLLNLTEEQDMGFIAMKALSGGLIRNVAAAFLFMKQHPHAVPIWGIQHEWELDQFLSMESNPPLLDEEMLAQMEKDHRELSGNFCRGCGYCLPCPVGIEINNAARMMFLLRRAPSQNFLNQENHDMMMRIDNCIHCDACKARCPYHLDTPTLLQENLADYRQFYEESREK